MFQIAISFLFVLIVAALVANVKKWRWNPLKRGGSVKIERPCWVDLNKGLREILTRTEKYTEEVVKKVGSDKTLLGLAARVERYELNEILPTFLFFHYGGSRNSKDNHIQLTSFDLANGTSCSVVRISEIHQLDDDVKRAKWMAPWAGVHVASSAIPVATQNLIGTDGFKKGNNFPRLPLAALATQRAAEWTRLGSSFEFVTIQGATELSLPSTHPNVQSLAVNATATATETVFIAGPGTVSMNFAQALCLWMSLTNGFSDKKFYARAFGITATNGHPIYFSKPAGLHNATIWHAMADQYGEWTIAAKAKADPSCLTQIARILISWGYDHMYDTMPIESNVPGTKANTQMIRFTAPVDSALTGAIDNAVLESAKDDKKLIINALVAHQKANLLVGTRSALPEIDPAKMKFFQKNGAFKKRA